MPMGWGRCACSRRSASSAASATPGFYQASTSELVGKAQEIPQKETTPFYPRSRYAAQSSMPIGSRSTPRGPWHARLERHLVQSREPDPGWDLRHRKITRAVASIEHGLQQKLLLGNLDVKRDWDHACDFAEGMWLMLQQDEPDDYLLATGDPLLREFVERAFAHVGRTMAC
jgi:GDPmannose 4,6-dehydratase